jgi:hypothetical protein
MKFRTLLLIALVTLGAGQAAGQKKMYTTTGGEWIFSWANAKWDGLDVNSITRFSPVFNFQTQVHRDMNDHFGFFSGLSMRNVGFIYDDPAPANHVPDPVNFQPGTSVRWKARNYTLGVPFGLKFGNMSGQFLFAGYEIEFPFNFKYKRFDNGDKKDVQDEWFSSRSPSVYHTVFFGIQSSYGTQIKFKYYLTNFFNKGFTTTDATGARVQPYSGFDANVFYISLSFQILKGTHFYYKDAPAKKSGNEL